MIFGMLVGFGIAVACYSLGHFTGYLMGVKVRNVTTLFAQPQETRRCICGHPIVGHVPLPKGGRGRCNCSVNSERVECACLGYVARPDPTPSKPAGLLQL